MKNFDAERIADRVWAAVRSEPCFDPLRDHVRGAVDHTIATLAGQVGNISVKKRIVRRVAALPELTGLVDRLRVAPIRRMGDSETSALLRNTLSQEPRLAQCTLQQRWKDGIETVRDVPDRCGMIIFEVKDGVVILDGNVPSLAHKQLVGVLSWWVPGRRDVVNGLAEMVREENADTELAKGVGKALEKDAVVDASQISVRAKDAVVLLHGSVPTETERNMAEFDAWYVFGVGEVANRIEVASDRHRLTVFSRPVSSMSS